MHASHRYVSVDTVLQYIVSESSVRSSFDRYRSEDSISISADQFASSFVYLFGHMPSADTVRGLLGKYYADNDIVDIRYDTYRRVVDDIVNRRLGEGMGHVYEDIYTSYCSVLYDSI